MGTTRNSAMLSINSAFPKVQEYSYCPQDDVWSERGNIVANTNELKNETRDTVVFPTSSAYEGQWNILGMSGEGKFVFPHGVVYIGNFVDGEFHGEGTLYYPQGQCIKGIWDKGKLINWDYIFQDNLKFKDDFSYCEYPDRRFYTSYLHGVQPAGHEFLSDTQPTPKLPPACFDTCDGYYYMHRSSTISSFRADKIIRIPTFEEEMWILKHCRKGWDEPTKYRPEFYEHWTAGYKEDAENILKSEQEKKKTKM